MANLIMIKKIYNTPKALENVVNYTINPNKTNGYIGGQNTLANTAADCMMSVINYYKSSGKLLENFVLSFDNTDVISLENIYLLSYNICNLLSEYQIIFGIHLDSDHKHVHFALNTTNIKNGSKFSFGYQETYQLLTDVCKLLTPYDMQCNLRFNSN